MNNCYQKCVEKILRAKKEALSRFEKAFFTVEIDSCLCQLMISLNPTKIALSCRVIISTCRMMVLFILRDSLDPQDRFSYA